MYFSALIDQYSESRLSCRRPVWALLLFLLCSFVVYSALSTGIYTLKTGGEVHLDLKPRLYWFAVSTTVLCAVYGLQQFITGYLKNLRE